MAIIPVTGAKPKKPLRPGAQDLVTRGPGYQPSQQSQSPGLLDQVPQPPARPGVQETVAGVVQQGQDALANPLDFSGLAPIRDQAIVQPSAQPVDVPQPAQASAPVTPNYNEQGAQQFRGPSELGYQGQRVGPGQQFSMNANNQAVDPSQKLSFDQNSGQQYGFDPNSGQYFNAPNRDFAQQGSELEQATFRRGMNNIDPYLQEQRQAMAQRLQNQGLPVGSEAYEGELNRFDRSRGNAIENLALSSVGAGRQEQGRLFGQDFASGQFNASEARRQFGERMGATQFNAGEDQRNFAQRLAGSQFQAGEEGRGFREALASNQNMFGQNLAGNQFNAGESGRNFGERFAGEGQYFNQRAAGDQFAASQGQAQNQFDAQQQRDLFGRAMQQGQFGAQQQQYGDQFNAQQGQQGFQNRFANQGMLQQNDQFLAQQQGQQFNQDLARRNQGINETMTQRQQPLNELGQILSLGNQAGNFAPQQPQFQQQPQYGPQPVNYGQFEQNSGRPWWQQGLEIAKNVAPFF